MITLLTLSDDDDSATVIYDSSDIGNIDSLFDSLRNTVFEPLVSNIIIIF